MPLRAASLDAGDCSNQYAEVDALDDLLTRHLATPFPASITKGLDYGDVDAVMIGADIYGWGSKASSGRLSPTDRVALQAARDSLARSLGMFPHEARAYYEMLLQLADLALDR